MQIYLYLKTKQVKTYVSKYEIVSTTTKLSTKGEESPRSVVDVLIMLVAMMVMVMVVSFFMIVTFMII